MTQEEILVKLGIDSSNISRGMGPAMTHGKMVGEQTGDAFSRGFISKIGLMRGGLYGAAAVAITTLTSAFKDLYGDKIAKTLGLDIFKAGRTEKEAGDRFADLEKKEAEFGAKVRQRREEEKKATLELQTMEKERISPLVAAKFKEAELTKQINNFQGSTLDRLKLIIERERERNVISKELAEFRKKGEEEGRKAQDEIKKADKERKEKMREEFITKTQLARIDREIADAQRKQNATDYDQFKPSLQDLAKSGSWVKFAGRRGFFEPGRFAGQANEIMRLEDQAKNQFMAGNVEGAKATVDRRNAMYEKLEKAGIVPIRPEKVAEAQIKMAQHIEDLHDQKTAMLMKPEMG